jgi:hypothetical protein
MLEGQEFDGSECPQEETMPSEPVKCHLVTHKDGCRHLIPNLSPMTISGYEAIGSSVVAHMAIPATDYAAMQSRITRLEEAIKNTLKYMDRLDGMIGPFHPNDFGAAHLRAALEEK